MSKVDQKLDELLNIQGEIVEVEKNLPTLSKTNHSKQEEQNSDYKYSREVFYGLVERGQDAIDGILELSKETEHPRAYEVAGQLIKTVSETAEKLIDIQKKLKDLEKEDSSVRTQHNHLYVGSTSELQKFLKKESKKDGNST